MDGTVREWVAIAKEDYDVARIAFHHQKYLHSVFLCQQAVEKMLKALYQHKFTEVPPRKHDLIRLADQTGILGTCSEGQKRLLSTLTEFYIEARYPGDRLELAARCTEESSRALLAETGRIMAWLQEQLTQS